MGCQNWTKLASFSSWKLVESSSWLLWRSFVSRGRRSRSESTGDVGCRTVGRRRLLRRRWWWMGALSDEPILLHSGTHRSQPLLPTPPFSLFPYYPISQKPPEKREGEEKEAVVAVLPWSELSPLPFLASPSLAPHSVY